MAQVPVPESGAYRRIHTRRELIEAVQALGFLPLFRNAVPGFSLQERSVQQPWWSGDAERDPWFWREYAARSGEVVYGKFFGGKAGFFSHDWFPILANFRRDGYDFDARWEDEKASYRAKKLMDCFLEKPEWTGAALKQAAGFGKGGEKNFDGVVTQLQMQTYLIIRDFRQKLNRRGEPYGLPVSIYMTPEAAFGAEAIEAAYQLPPEASGELLLARLRALCPEAAEKQLLQLLRPL